MRKILNYSADSRGAGRFALSRAALIFEFSDRLLVLIILSLYLSACGKAFEARDFSPQVSTSANPYKAENASKIDGKINPYSNDKDTFLDSQEYEDLKEQLLAQKNRKPDQISNEITDVKQVRETLSFCLSPSLGELKSKAKKDFVCRILPDAIRMNIYVYKQRIMVLSLKKIAEKNSLKSDEIDWLDHLRSDYSLSADADFDKILERVDIVPLSLLLAQAAIESAWGTSRAAVQANNFFGIHGVIGIDNCLIALKDASVCIKKYGSIVEGVADYIEFLNTKRSTDKFRKLRAQQRLTEKVMNPLKLSATLVGYSEIGQQYVKQVNEMILGQNFINLDDGSPSVATRR